MGERIEENQEQANLTLNQTLANLSLLNDSDIINLQNEVDGLNAGIFDLEASLLIGTVAALVLMALCLIFACWYFLVRKKKFNN